MKVALVYDRVNKFGGAERVLISLHEIFPEAPLYTSVYDNKNANWAKIFPQVYTSFLQNIPFIKNNHEFVPFLMPLAFSSFNFDEYDLVISVTSEFAKNLPRRQAGVNAKYKHICYCLTPTRYLWSHHHEYLKNKYLRFALSPLINYLKKVDKKAAKKPDVMIAISTEVQKRIKKYYGRNSQIIFPPVDTNPSNRQKISDWLTARNYYLVVSRLVSYKKVDLATKAFNKLKLPLLVIGIGREENKLKKLAKENIKFAGFVSENKLASYYKNAKALIFPQEEDFGIVAVEAQSYGVPVIAYKKGGSIDTVIDKKTGILFTKQNEKGLISAIKKFEKTKFNKKAIIQNSKKFSKEKFQKEILQLVKSLW